MANQEERIFKKIYTDFDKRLDQELDEEKAERRRQLLLQAPNFKLLNMMVENEKYSQELAAKLKDGGLYYLRSREEENVENKKLDKQYLYAVNKIWLENDLDLTKEVEIVS